MVHIEECQGKGLRDSEIRGVMKGAGNRWKVEEDFELFHLPPSTCPLLLALG